MHAFETKYKSKNKTDLLKIIKDNKIDKHLYDIPYFNPQSKQKHKEKGCYEKVV